VPEAVCGTYAPRDSDEALALDAACAQGGALRLSFHRPSFHARADRYPERVILTARLEGRLVGTLAVAAKPVEFLGRPARAAFAFDLRVHPDARRRGIARALAREGLAWAERHADLVYAYSVDDNRAAARVCELMGLVECGAYAYLVCPSTSLAPSGEPARAVAYPEAHAAFVAAAGPFDLAADPRLGSGESGYAGSWLLRTADGLAGCSACSQRAILAEVVEGLPAPLRIARALERAGMPWPQRWPKLPRDGDELRSWYVFDAFATRPDLGARLVRHVAGEARRRGIDWCHLVHTGRDAWVGALRADLPRLFSPVLRYRLLARRFGGAPLVQLRRLQVDVRDI
jgi:GNAT superfamily N-acetyltransferase